MAVSSWVSYHMQWMNLKMSENTQEMQLQTQTNIFCLYIKNIPIIEKKEEKTTEQCSHNSETEERNKTDEAAAIVGEEKPRVRPSAAK